MLFIVAVSAAATEDLLRVAKLIDGRDTVAAHGTRDMPIWGARYRQEAMRARRCTYRRDSVDKLKPQHRAGDALNRPVILLNNSV